MNCAICSAPITPGQQQCLACGASLGTQALAAGSILQGKYRIDNVLGQGGFGITYGATQLNLTQRVAIKELFPAGAVRQTGTLRAPTSLDASGWLQAKRDFSDEGRTLARFNHPSIVRVTDHFEEGGTAYLVMEYLVGETLTQRIEREGPLPSVQVESIARSVLEALALVHSANLLHRDLKPDNIYLEQSGRTVLIDFGSARNYSSGKTISHTRLVTPGYAPLEQYGTQGRFGPYTDIYALGATLWHALSGTPPPASTDLAQGTTLPALPASVSPALRQLVLQCMRLKVSERPQSSQQALALLAAAPPAPTPAPPPQPAPAPSPAPVPAPTAPKRSGVSVLPLIVLAGLSWGAYQLYQQYMGTTATAYAPATTPAEESTSTPAEDLSEVEVVALNINLRAAPDPNSEKLGLIPRGESMSVLQAQNGWYEVEYQGRRGWVSGTYALPIVPYREVQRLLTAVQTGGAIELQRGVYRLNETLVLTQDTDISGQGRDSTIISSSVPETTLLARGVNTSLTDLSVQHTGDAFARVLMVEGGHLALSRTRLSGGLRDESIEDYGSGVWLKDAAHGDITDSELTANAYGAYVSDQSTVTVERSILGGNSQGGILFKDESSGAVSESAIDGNGVHGAHVAGNATPTFTDNKIRNNKQRGVSVYGQAAPVLEGNLLENNGYQGIGVQDSAAPTIRGNTIQGNKQSGITFFDNTSGETSRNLIQGNARAGIGVTEYANPAISSNTIRNNIENGVFFSEHASGTADGNTIEGNGNPGVAAWGDAQPTVYGNVVQRNKQSGIVFADRAGGEVRENTVQENALFGVIITDAAQPDLLSNQVHGNKRAAILYKQDAAGSAYGNSCYENGEGDIHFELNPGNYGPSLSNDECLAPAANLPSGRAIGRRAGLEGVS